jgi:hypothetical protein
VGLCVYTWLKVLSNKYSIDVAWGVLACDMCNKIGISTFSLRGHGHRYYGQCFKEYSEHSLDESI